jgi:nucleoside-diphosphate-sugar epimerase
MKIIITGATGMVGEGVLLECLQDKRVETILSVSRQTCGKTHPKLKELLVNDFMSMGNYTSQLTGYDTCFFCAGVSSVGMPEEKYHRLTYDMTIRFAEAVLQANPGMSFVYVSGAHTDGTEKGKLMWARVKGKTENALSKMGFKTNYNFRPGVMKPYKGQVHLKGINKYVHILYPVMALIFPACTLTQVAQAMMNTVEKGYSKKVLEVKDIKQQSILNA